MILIIICIISYDLTTSNIRNANSADSIGDTIATNSSTSTINSRGMCSRREGGTCGCECGHSGGSPVRHGEVVVRKVEAHTDDV